MQAVVAARRHGQRLHRHLAAAQLVRVAQVDERVPEARDHAVDHGVGPLEQELSHHRLPVVAVQDELVLEEIHKRPLVLLLAQEVAPVVLRDLAR